MHSDYHRLQVEKHKVIVKQNYASDRKQSNSMLLDYDCNLNSVFLRQCQILCALKERATRRSSKSRIVRLIELANGFIVSYGDAKTFQRLNGFKLTKSRSIVTLCNLVGG